MMLTSETHDAIIMRNGFRGPTAILSDNIAGIPGECRHATDCACGHTLNAPASY